MLAWNAVVVEEMTRKQEVADDMHCYLLLKRCFVDWEKVCFLFFTLIQFANFSFSVCIPVT